MRVIIEQSYEEICNWIAIYIKFKINNHDNTKPFVLGLPTGSTPIGVYQKLIEFYKKGELSFKNVITFNMDEYVELNPENPQSYHYFMKNNFFNHIDIPKNNINIPSGIAPNLEQECKNYENKINSLGGINLFLCGLGSDGHIAFNEPGSSFESLTRIKTLSHETISDNSRFFKSMDEVPKQAITVGVKTVTQSKEIILMASGYNKSEAIRECIEGSISNQYTCTFIQFHPKAIIVCDKLASYKMRLKTYLYYKDLQHNIDLLGNPIKNKINNLIKEDHNVLITSPHPDDDVIGMGGTMEKLKYKKKVQICYLTSGSGGVKKKVDRIAEATCSVKILGYLQEQVESLKLPFYSNSERLISTKDAEILKEYIISVNPNHIFICIDNDPKGTHKKCAKIIQEACKDININNFWLYKSAWGNWNECKNPSLVRNYIDKDSFAKKLQSINMHTSQINPIVTYKEKIHSFCEISKKKNKSDIFPNRYEENFLLLKKNTFLEYNFD